MDFDYQHGSKGGVLVALKVMFKIPCHILGCILDYIGEFRVQAAVSLHFEGIVAVHRLL